MGARTLITADWMIGGYYYYDFTARKGFTGGYYDCYETMNLGIDNIFPWSRITINSYLHTDALHPKDRAQKPRSILPE